MCSERRAILGGKNHPEMARSAAIPARGFAASSRELAHTHRHRSSPARTLLVVVASLKPLPLGRSDHAGKGAHAEDGARRTSTGKGGNDPPRRDDLSAHCHAALLLQVGPRSIFRRARKPLTLPRSARKHGQ
jgi:hypothetical protein